MVMVGGLVFGSAYPKPIHKKGVTATAHELQSTYDNLAGASILKCFNCNRFGLRAINYRDKLDEDATDAVNQLNVW